MASGIEWFRWHHGSVADPKFGLIAKQAGATVAEVLGVWACLLEAASAAEDRGDPGAVDFETIDFLLGLADGTAARIHERMRERGLIDAGTGRIASWDKRQPRRERDSPDTGAAERKRRQRAQHAGDGGSGEGEELPGDGAAGNDEAGADDAGAQDAAQNAGNGACAAAPSAHVSRHVTPRHATSRQKTPRGEERRKRNTKPPHPPPEAGGAFGQFWSEWPAHRRKVGEPQCRRRWRAAGCDAIADRIMAALQAAKGSDAWVKEGGAYVPSPLVWLAQRRWEAPTEADAAAQRQAEHWHETRSGIEAKGEALGLGRWDERAFEVGMGEHWPAYQARVYAAAAWPPQAGRQAGAGHADHG